MLEFKEFLIESSSSSLRDPKGKLFELLVAKNMHPSGYFPNIFRDNGKTPKQVHDELKVKIPPDDYSKINNGAQKTSQHILKTLHDSKVPGIEKKPDRYHIGHESSVAWVSNPTDYKKLMDKHSTIDNTTKSNADIVITHHAKNQPANHHAISLKYSSRIPTESGPGLQSLENHIGDKNKTLRSISEISNKEIHKIIGEDNREKARNIFKNLPKNHPTSLKIQEASLKGTTSIAKEYHKGLTNLDQKSLRKTLDHLSSINTKHIFTHYRARYNPDKDSVKITNPTKQHKNIMNAVKTVVPTLSGTSVHFHGITHEGNEIHLGTLNVKRRDSPVSNIQGSYKLGKIYY